MLMQSTAFMSAGIIVQSANFNAAAAVLYVWHLLKLPQQNSSHACCITASGGPIPMCNYLLLANIYLLFNAWRGRGFWYIFKGASRLIIIESASIFWDSSLVGRDGVVAWADVTIVHCNDTSSSSSGRPPTWCWNPSSRIFKSLFPLPCEDLGARHKKHT